MKEIIFPSVLDSFSGSTTTTKSYTDRTMVGFAIFNLGASDLTFTINGMTITVSAGESFDDYFKPFSSIVVTTSVAYKAIVRGY